MRISITYLATVFIALLCVIAGHAITAGGLEIFQNSSQEVVQAKVQRVLERQDVLESSDDITHFRGEIIIFEAEVTKGQRRGSVLMASQSAGDFSLAAPKEVEQGDSVLLTYNPFNNEWYLYGHLRTNRLLALGIFFTLCVLIFGGKKGFNTILSLSLTCGAVFGVFIPAILSGKNIYVMALLVCAYTIVMTLLLVVGFTKKTLTAITGCASGLAVAGIITLVMDRALFLTGIIDEHSRFLVNLNLPGGALIDLKAIIFAGIIIGAMGAVMDVALSISSSLWEIKEKAKTINFETLLHSGLTIGRDIMGSMANTLILAYIGSSLPVVLLLTVYSDSLFGLLNREMIVVEILQALAGSLGILFAMPLTAFFCAVLYLKSPAGKR